MEPAELFRLLLAVLLAPVVFVLARRLEGARSISCFVASFVAICFSYVFSVVESVVFFSFFNMLQHVSYGVGGALALAGAVALRRGVMAGHGMR
jgi:hypothetical protein